MGHGNSWEQGTKIRKWGDGENFLMCGCLCLKCSKTQLYKHTYFKNFPAGDSPRTLVKRGKGQKRAEGRGKVGRLRHCCRGMDAPVPLPLQIWWICHWKLAKSRSRGTQNVFASSPWQCVSRYKHFIGMEPFGTITVLADPHAVTQWFCSIRIGQKQHFAILSYARKNACSHRWMCVTLQL